MRRGIKRPRLGVGRAIQPPTVAVSRCCPFGLKVLTNQVDDRISPRAPASNQITSPRFTVQKFPPLPDPPGFSPVVPTVVPTSRGRVDAEGRGKSRSHRSGRAESTAPVLFWLFHESISVGPPAVAGSPGTDRRGEPACGSTVRRVPVAVLEERGAVRRLAAEDRSVSRSHGVVVTLRAMIS